MILEWQDMASINDRIHFKQVFRCSKTIHRLSTLPAPCASHFDLRASQEDILELDPLVKIARKKRINGFPSLAVGKTLSAIVDEIFICCC
jgi:hypothetical protein